MKHPPKPHISLREGHWQVNAKPKVKLNPYTVAMHWCLAHMVAMQWNSKRG